MGFLYEKNSGARVLVPMENELEAWRSGRFSLPMDQKVNVVRADGKQTVEIDPTDLEQMLSLGWHLETPDERKGRVARKLYGDSEGKAFGAGVARGVTFGLSDMALTGLDIVEPTTLDALRMANPTATTAGEVTGIVGGSLLPVGAAVRGTGVLAKGLQGAGKLASKLPAAQVSRLGGAVGRTVEQALLPAAVKGGKVGKFAREALARTSGYAVGGAVEGALYGTGRAITESALGDPDAVGEALVAHIGPEAVLGGTIGGAFGAASKLGGATLSGLKGLMEKAAPKAEVALEKSLDEQIFKKVFNMSKSVRRKASPQKTEAFKEFIFDESILPDGAIAKPGLKKDEIKERLIKASDFHGENIGAFFNNIDELAAKAGVTLDEVPRPESIIANIDQELERLRDSIGPDVRRRTNLLEEMKRDILDAGPWTYKKAWELKKDMANKVPWGRKLSDWTPEQETYKLLHDSFKVEIDDAVGRAFKKIPDAMEGVELTAAQALRENYQTSRKVYWAIADFAEAASKDVSFDASQFNKILTNFVGSAGRNVALRMLIPSYGVATAITRGAAVAGVTSGLPLAKGMFSAGTALNQVNNFAKMGAIQQAVDKTQKTIDSTAKSVFDAADRVKVPLSIGFFRAFTGEKDRKKAAEKFAQRIYAEAADPEALVQKMTASLAGLEEVAPNISQGAGAHAARLMQTLLEISPKKQALDIWQPDKEPLFKSDREVLKYERLVSVILKPENFFKAVKNGTISPEMIQVFRKVYPKLFETLIQRIVEETAQGKKPLSRSRRKMLNMLVGTAHPLNPGIVARSQAVYAEQPEQQAEGKGVSGISIRGLDKAHKLSDSRYTGTQRLET